MFCLPQVVAGEKVCIVTVLGTSRGCRNDESHTSATVEQCPIDELSVSVKLQYRSRETFPSRARARRVMARHSRVMSFTRHCHSPLTRR